METKTCTKCNHPLPITEFHTRSTKSNRLQSMCKDCRSKHNQQWWQTHKEYARAAARIREAKTREENRTKSLEYLLSHPCVDCGETDPVVLDYDYDNPKQKFRDICGLIGSRYTWKVIRVEIKKCTVRCANCHRRKMAKQFNHYKYRISSSNPF